MQLFSPCNPWAFPCWPERVGEVRTSGTQCNLCEGNSKTPLGRESLAETGHSWLDFQPWAVQQKYPIEISHFGWCVDFDLIDFLNLVR